MYFYIYPVGGGFSRPKTGSMSTCACLPVRVRTQTGTHADRNQTPTSKTPSANNLLTPEFWFLTSSLQDTIHEIPALGTIHRAPTFSKTRNLQLKTHYLLHITHHLLLFFLYTRYYILYTIFFPLYISRSAIPLVRRKSSRLFLK